MKLSDLETVNDLKIQLRAVDEVLAAFQRVPGDTVAAYATSDRANYSRGYRVQLLPVPKSLAVSAALREREKVVARLAALGVTVDPPIEYEFKEEVLADGSAGPLVFTERFIKPGA